MFIVLSCFSEYKFLCFPMLFDILSLDDIYYVWGLSSFLQKLLREIWYVQGEPKKC